jgi:hypothetical protein
MQVTAMSNLTRQLAALAFSAIAITAPGLAQVPVDDMRVRQLEGDVQRLQREVDTQSRRIQMLEQAARINSPAVLPFASGPRADSSPAWLVAASWDRIKPGMKPTEVIAILGRPTSTRTADDGKLRLLFYAMEVGTDAVLSGTIRVDDSGVVEINRPVLK